MDAQWTCVDNVRRAALDAMLTGNATSCDGSPPSPALVAGSYPATRLANEIVIARCFGPPPINVDLLALIDSMGMGPQVVPCTGFGDGFPVVVPFATTPDHYLSNAPCPQRAALTARQRANFRDFTPKWIYRTLTDQQLGRGIRNVQSTFPGALVESARRTAIDALRYVAGLFRSDPMGILDRARRCWFPGVMGADVAMIPQTLLAAADALETAEFRTVPDSAADCDMAMVTNCEEYQFDISHGIPAHTFIPASGGYIVLYETFFGAPSYQATRLAHEGIHLGSMGAITHGPNPLLNAWGYSGLVAELAGLPYDAAAHHCSVPSPCWPSC